MPELKAGVSSIDELTYVMRREEASGFQRHERNTFMVGGDQRNSRWQPELAIYIAPIRIRLSIHCLPQVTAISGAGQLLLPPPVQVD